MRREISCVLVLAVIVSGCASPVRVATPELVKLDGFQAGDEVVLRGLGGGSVTFREDTALGLHLMSGDELAHRYDRVEIIDDVFYGVVAGTESQVAVSLRDIAGARVWPSTEGEYPELAIMIATMWLVIGLAAFAVWAIVRYVDWDDVDVVVVYH